MNPSAKPNIVFIMTDDQGPWALGCAGNKEIQTPNLDRLAAEGVRLDNFFCASPVCSPARASLLTGRIPSQHGIHDWIEKGNAADGAIEYLQDQLAYTELLAQNGYVCGLSGKWHLGDSMKPQKGFTHWYAHESGGGPYYNAPMIRDGALVREKDYITDVITDDALEFIDRQAESPQPFYLSVHYTAPHSPWIGNHPQAYLDLYEDCAFESCPQEPHHPWSYKTQNEPPEKVRQKLIGYFAAVTAMDYNVGRIMERIDKLGLREHTLICFLSDNGFNCGHHGIWGKGNGTFPQNMYDSSVKVPAIFSQPGTIPQGAVSEALVSGYDWMPTLLEYVGIGNPEAERLPGRSFLGSLRGSDTDERDNVVVFDEYGPVRMIRSREWKYVHRYPYGPHELYDLTGDPGERHNLTDAEDYRGQLEAMKARLDEWFVRYADPAVDGSREPVTGSGQMNLAGPAGRGARAFSDTYLKNLR
ncbi:sulfatase-like hydrolase/transferase [Paenibacillus ginsengarvi]|uniref:Sulfatase n=1 Tax=Paenibacillus ginsengarvi TaxID=400777 RepID=A0A3B0AKP9_9BACL|nr:sulfatase-like hydrolase/transferase [Paenibacillus ginsengarvi]RKN61270.1 sulfatase [Paenibacillus ginsengarvi]